MKDRKKQKKAPNGDTHSVEFSQEAFQRMEPFVTKPQETNVHMVDMNSELPLSFLKLLEQEANWGRAVLWEDAGDASLVTPFTL